jgi:hypothetical protein
MSQLPTFRDWRWNQHMTRSIDEALMEVEREAHIRIKCFDNWVAAGKLSWSDAYDRLERLLSAIKHLRDMQTQLKLTELRETKLNTPASGDQVAAFAQEAHDLINTVAFPAETPADTAPQASSEKATRQSIA